eukprot:4474770-Pleurochrysis_carterae.AAC.1
MPRDVPDKPQPARLSRTVLLLFSGPFKRPEQAGLEVEMIDNHPEHGGGGSTTSCLTPCTPAFSSNARLGITPPSSRLRLAQLSQ